MSAGEARGGGILGGMAAIGGANGAVEAGAGRPFRFSLVLGEREGSLAYWLGGRWALGFGLFTTAIFAAGGGLAAALLDGGPAPREVFLFAGAALGAGAVALHLRPRRVAFERRDGTWCWRPRRLLGPRTWFPITEEKPLLLEREILSSLEGWTLSAGTVRLFTYLGDPSIGRSVTLAFQRAGVPCRTVMKRSGEE